MTNLHEYVSATGVSFSWHTGQMHEKEHMHFAEVWRAVYVDEARDILVREMSEEGDLAQHPFCERDFLERASDHLDRDRLARNLVRG